MTLLTEGPLLFAATTPWLSSFQVDLARGDLTIPLADVQPDGSSEFCPGSFSEDASLLRGDLHAAWRHLQERGRQGISFPQNPLARFEGPFSSRWVVAGRGGGEDLFVEASLPLCSRYVHRQVFSRDAGGVLELRVGEERLRPLFDAPSQGDWQTFTRWEVGSARSGALYPFAPTGVMRSVKAVYGDASLSFDLLFLGAAILDTLAPAVMKMKGPKEPLRGFVARMPWRNFEEALEKVLKAFGVAWRLSDPLKELVKEIFFLLTGEKAEVAAIPDMTPKEGRLLRYIVDPPKVSGWHLSREGQPIEFQCHKGAILISYRPLKGTRGLNHRTLRRLWGDALTEWVEST